jgi:chromate transporter
MSKRVEGLAEPAHGEKVSLAFLFWSFLKIGSTAFGGFMALISVAQQYFVQERRLIRHEDMLDGISLATMLPGPMAVNTVAFIGYSLRGVAGAAVSVIAVILPSFLLVVALAAFYFRFGEIPVVDKAFAAFLPAVTAIIIASAWNLGKKSARGRVEMLLAGAALLLLLLIGGFYVTIGTIVAGGIIGWLVFRQRMPAGGPSSIPSRPLNRFPLTLGAMTLATLVLLFVFQPAGIDPNSSLQLLVTFAGMSLLLFGGGFVFIPLIQEIVVAGFGWVTQAEFAIAIAVGQVTPGPILISAAFIGYKLLGVWGAFVATAAIFTPSAVLMIMASHLLARIKTSRNIQAALVGIRAVVVGLIFAAAVVIAQTMPVHWLSAAILVAALVALLRFNVGAIWIIPAAGLLGVLFY